MRYRSSENLQAWTPNLKQQGFTLIELLMAIVLIGILAGIAVPLYADYKAGSFDAIANHALRSVAAAEEAYFVDYAAYKDCDQTTCPAILPAIDPFPAGVSLQIVASQDTFSGTASHRLGTGKTYSWQS